MLYHMLITTHLFPLNAGLFIKIFQVNTLGKSSVQLHGKRLTFYITIGTKSIGSSRNIFTIT